MAWLVTASDQLGMLSEPRANVLVEVYLLGLPCADSLLALTLRGESIGVEVVLDLLFLAFFLLWPFSCRANFRADAMGFALMQNESALALKLYE